MKFKIEVFQNKESIFAKILDENNEEICICDSNTPYAAVKEACSKLSNMMDIIEDKENEIIKENIKKRDKNDNGIRYTSEDVTKMRLANKIRANNIKIIK